MDAGIEFDTFLHLVEETSGNLSLLMSVDAPIINLIFMQTNEQHYIILYVSNIC
jgi:hypothetical protein